MRRRTVPAVQLGLGVAVALSLRCGGAQRSDEAAFEPQADVSISSLSPTLVEECVGQALRQTIGESWPTTGGACSSSGREPIATGDYRFGSSHAPATNIRLCAMIRDATVRFSVEPYSVADGRDDGCSAHGGWYSRYHWKTLPSRGYFESMAAEELSRCLEESL